MRSLELITGSSPQRLYYYGTITDSNAIFNQSLKGRHEKTNGQYLIPGFRKPTSYGAFYGKVDVDPYDYEPVSGGGDVSDSGWSAPPNDSVGGHFGFSGTYPNFEPNVSLNLRNQVSTEALAKINAGDLELGIALAEAKSTYTLIAGTTLRVLKAYKATRGGNYRVAMKHLGIYKPNDKRLRGIMSIDKRRAGTAWLQMQFGWLPLLNDIHGAIQTLNRDWKLSEPVLSVVRRRTIDADLPYSSGTPNFKSEGSSKQTAEVKYFYKISDPTLYVLNNLGLLNPVSIFWELVPFSFVVDWFMPVGTFLRALTSDVGVDYLSGYELLRRKSSVRATFTRYEWDPVGSQCSYSVDNYCWRRYILPSPRLPTLYIKLGFSTRRGISALALIQQRAR